MIAMRKTMSHQDEWLRRVLHAISLLSLCYVQIIDDVRIFYDRDA